MADTRNITVNAENFQSLFENRNFIRRDVFAPRGLRVLTPNIWAAVAIRMTNANSFRFHTPSSCVYAGEKEMARRLAYAVAGCCWRWSSQKQYSSGANHRRVTTPSLGSTGRATRGSLCHASPCSVRLFCVFAPPPERRQRRREG